MQCWAYCQCSINVRYEEGEKREKGGHRKREWGREGESGMADLGSTGKKGPGSKCLSPTPAMLPFGTQLKTCLLRLLPDSQVCCPVHLGEMLLSLLAITKLH